MAYRISTQTNGTTAADEFKQDVDVLNDIFADLDRDINNFSADVRQNVQDLTRSAVSRNQQLQTQYERFVAGLMSNQNVLSDLNALDQYKPDPSSIEPRYDELTPPEPVTIPEVHPPEVNLNLADAPTASHLKPDAPTLKRPDISEFASRVSELISKISVVKPDAPNLGDAPTPPELLQLPDTSSVQSDIQSLWDQGKQQLNQLPDFVRAINAYKETFHSEVNTSLSMLGTMRTELARSQALYESVGSVPESPLEGLAAIDVPTPPTLGPQPTPPELLAGSMSPPEPPVLNMQIGSVPTPVISYPPPPELSNLTIPDPPEINLPSAEFTPVNMPTLASLGGYTPPSRFEKFDVAQLQRIIATLQNEIDGVSNTFSSVRGLFSGVIDTTLEREAEKAVASVVNSYSRSGFTRPSGALDARVDSIRMDTFVRQGNIAKEAAKMLADAAVSWRNKSVDAIGALAAVAQRAVQGINELALTKAETAAKLEIETARLDLDRAEMDIKLATLELEANKAQLEAAVRTIELYTAKIDALRSIAAIDEARVKVFATQVEAEGRKIDQYAAQIQAEALKIETQKAVVQVYAEQVNAYAAQLQADKAKVDAYLGQLDIYKTPIEVAKIQMEGAKLEADTRQALASAYNSTVQGYKAQLDAATSMGRSIAERAKTELEVAGLYLNIASATIDAETKTAVANIEAAKTYVSAITPVASALLSLQNMVVAETTKANEELMNTFSKSLAQYQNSIGAYEAYLQSITVANQTNTAYAEGAKAYADAITATAGGFQAEVSAYTAYIDSVKAINDYEQQVIREVLDSNKEALQLAEQSILTYKQNVSAIDTAVATYSNAVNSYKSAVTIEDGRMTGLLAKLSGDVKTYDSALDATTKKIDFQFRHDATKAKLALDLYMDTAKVDDEAKQIALQILDSRYKMYNTFLSSLVSAVNYNVSLGQTASFSQSLSKAVQEAYTVQTVVEGQSKVPDATWTHCSDVKCP